MIYIHLFHGRNDPDAEMEEVGKDNGGWGFDGPQFCCESIHGTYCSHFRLWRTRTIVSDGLVQGIATIADDEMWLFWYEDMIYYDGKFYGDFSIAAEPVDGHEITFYEESKATLSPEWEAKLKESQDEQRRLRKQAEAAGG